MMRVEAAVKLDENSLVNEVNETNYHDNDLDTILVATLKNRSSVQELELSKNLEIIQYKIALTLDDSVVPE